MTISRVGKQLLGAGIGMTLATVLYMGLEQMSLTSSGMKAYLVSPGQNIAESVGEVKVNDTTADSTTLARLSRFATTVANQMKQNDALRSTSPGAQINNNVQARKEARMADAVQISALATAVEYPNVIAEVTQRERLAIRSARALADQHAGAPVYVPNPNVVEVPTSLTKTSETKDFKGYKPVEMVTIPKVSAPVQVVPPVSPAPAPAPVQVSPPQTAPIVTNPVPVPVVTVTPPTVPAPTVTPPPVVPQTPPSKDLPDSGLGLNLLIALSLMMSFVLIRPDLRSRVIASLRHSFYSVE